MLLGVCSVLLVLPRVCSNVVKTLTAKPKMIFQVFPSPYPRTVPLSPVAQMGIRVTVRTAGTCACTLSTLQINGPNSVKTLTAKLRTILQDNRLLSEDGSRLAIGASGNDGDDAVDQYAGRGHAQRVLFLAYNKGMVPTRFRH